MAYIVPHADLDQTPAFDIPDPAHPVPTAIVMVASTSDLLRAEQEFGRDKVYIPRVTDHTRIAGRSRKITRVVQLQWPGYAFVHSSHAHILPDLVRRFYFRHMDANHPNTRIPIAQLQPSRLLEIRSSQGPSKPPSPRSPVVGDLVYVPAGLWSGFQGTVVRVRNHMLVVSVPHSSIDVHAHPDLVTVLDRKKVLA